MTKPASRAGAPRRLLWACVTAVVIGVAGVPLSALPLPRADLDVRRCLAPHDVPAGMWLLMLGTATGSLVLAALLGRWAVPQVLRGRRGLLLGLVAVLGTAAATWNARWIATLPYDCGAPIPVLEPLFTLVPTAIATGLGIASRHRFLTVITAGLLVAAPIVLVLSLGWALYRPDAARVSLYVSAVSILLGSSPALGALGATGHRGHEPRASAPG